MDSQLGPDRKPLSEEIHNSPGQEKENIPTSMTSFQKIEEGGKRKVRCRITLKTITPDRGTVQVLHPSENQLGLLVPAPRPAVKKLDKAVDMKTKTANLKFESDKETVQVKISQCGSKRRRILSATAQLDKEVASGPSKIKNVPHKYIQQQEIDEIDLPDVNNHLAVVEYIKDLYTFYKEQQHMYRPVDYLKNQLKLNEGKRAVTIGWMVKVHYQLRLWPETLYLAVSIIDRYLSLDIVLREQLQLVALCALLIASKYEENQPLKVDYFVQLTQNKYSKEVIICMEKIMLNSLEWYLTVPTTYHFLVRFVKASKADKELENMIYFFGELGLLEYKLIQYCPSKVAAAAVYAARCTLGKSPLWTDALQRHTSYSEQEIQEIARILAKAHVAAPDSKHKLRVVSTKYQLEQFERVSVYPPASVLVEEPQHGDTAAS